MIQVTIFKNQNDEFTRMTCLGHAGYADAGEDIVCAGVSALVINTINSIATFTQDKIMVDSEEETGMIVLDFDKPAGNDAALLMKSLVLGLQGIQNTYGNEYIVLNFKEV